MASDRRPVRLSHFSAEVASRRRVATLAALRAEVRAFFHAGGYVEVDTPVLLRHIAPEEHIQAFAVTVDDDGATIERFLQTSPELAMKTLLGLGHRRIYQIAPVFRSEPTGPWHNIEFRLLEWYRETTDWLDIIDEVEALLTRLAQVTALGPTDPTSSLGRQLRAGPLPRYRIDDLFREYCGFSILDHLDRDTLFRATVTLGLQTDPADSFSDLFHRVWLNRIEPQLLARAPCVWVTHYPAPLASLARLDAGDPRVACRAELYLEGIEVANAYFELSDPATQRARFDHDRQRMIERGYPVSPMSEAFFDAVPSLTNVVGIAVGLDRLFTTLLGGTHLDAGQVPGFRDL